MEKTKEKKSLLRILALVLTIALSVAAVCFFGWFARWSLLNLGTPDGSAAGSESNLALMDKYDMYITNQISEALEGVFAVDKVYWLNDYELIAPEPDQSRFGSSGDPTQLQWLLDEAAEMLGIESFLFHTGIQLLPGTEVNWYLDETIFAITWQEAKDQGVYTFSEVKIAHATQMRRFLAGGTYGYGKQFLTTEMASDVNAVVASSGDFYKFRNYGAVVTNGQVHRANGWVDTCFIDDKADMILVKAGQLNTVEEAQAFVDANNIRFSLAFGPILIQDGVRCEPGDYIIGEINDQYPRAALCQVESLHYLLAVANSMSGYPHLPNLHQFADRLEQMGVKTAYTLDGGQTGVIVMNDRMISPVQYGSQRQISDILYFATALPDGG